jgi:hypothetical protein
VHFHVSSDLRIGYNSVYTLCTFTDRLCVISLGEAFLLQVHGDPIYFTDFG